ncbi:MAG TPA: hypothetical protein VJ866_18295 [Pyrinomonadaceae bacterium]|nr:hypothetical protein [Pyrinomonadaceae bacterium]
MNNLAYTSQDAEYVGPKVEEKVREEVGADAPMPYRVETGEAATVSVGSFVGDVARGLVGGKDETLFRLRFGLPRLLPAELWVSVNRQGVGSHVGLLHYSAKLSTLCGGEVALEDPKFFGKSKFVGMEPTASRLNANGELIKRANGLARVESQSGGLTLKIKRCCKVFPFAGGSMLVVATLPRPVKMGFGAAIDARDFFDLADMLEAAL